MSTQKRGSTGSLVEAFQLALFRSGYLTDEPDGVFGNRTRDAVMRFQRANGLKPDGAVGELTQKALSRYLTGYFVYTVAFGDTFYSIAKKYGTTVRAIRTANPNADPMDLHVGSKLTVPYGFDLVPTNISYSYMLTECIVTGIKARYPFIKRGTFGKSVTGRNLYTLSIGNGNKQVFYSAAIHANEWITAPLLLKFLEEYAFQYSVGGAIGDYKASELYNEATIVFAPLTNPDGVDLVTGALQSGAYYNTARTYSDKYTDIPFPSGWKANIRGVDLNLQFPAGWEQAREMKFAEGYISPAPREYVGKAPLTEPESRALYNFTRENDFALILAYHTQGNLIYWKYADLEPERSREIGERLSRESGYPLVLTPEPMAFAGYKDWFISAYDLPGYTVEAGSGTNPLPLSQFDGIYRNNVGLLTAAAVEA